MIEVIKQIYRLDDSDFSLKLIDSDIIKLEEVEIYDNIEDYIMIHVKPFNYRFFLIEHKDINVFHLLIYNSGKNSGYSYDNLRFDTLDMNSQKSPITQIGFEKYNTYNGCP